MVSQIFQKRLTIDCHKVFLTLVTFLYFDLFFSNPESFSPSNFQFHFENYARGKKVHGSRIIIFLTASLLKELLVELDVNRNKTGYCFWSLCFSLVAKKNSIKIPEGNHNQFSAVSVFWDCKSKFQRCVKNRERGRNNVT